jgi:hypothetical protein
MAVTLAQVKVNLTDAVSMGVIDEFRKASYILDTIPFEPAVSPVGGGSTLTYGYTRVTTQPTAGTRAVNSEYTPQHAVKTRYTVDLAVFGGSFQIDRVLASTGGIVNEVDFQVAQKIKAARAEFHHLFINGDTGSDGNAFDGLDKAVTGSTTEYFPLDHGITAGYHNLDSAANVTSNYVAFLDALDEFLASLDGKPSALLGCGKLLSKIKACARRAAAYSQTLDAFGRNVDTYDGIPLVDMGDRPGSTLAICNTKSRDADEGGGGGAIAGLADLYAVRFGADGLHAISMAGQSPVKAFLPDFNTSGAVKTGEVEMVAAIALKATKAAGVFRNIKVASASDPTS